MKFLMSSGQRLMADRWEELGREDGPYIISEAAYQFMRLFICDRMQEFAKPLAKEVATRFLQWGTKPQFDNDDDIADGSSGGGGGGKKNGGGHKRGGGNQNPYKRRFIGQPGKQWYQKGDTITLDLFSGLSTKVEPRQWQLLYYPVDQCTALDIGKPKSFSATMSETLWVAVHSCHAYVQLRKYHLNQSGLLFAACSELYHFPLDRQLLNIRFAKSVPPVSESVLTNQPATCEPGRVGSKYASFLRYKVSEHLMTNEEWRFLEPVEILQTTGLPSRTDSVHNDSASNDSPPHFAIRLERTLERTIQTVFLPQFLIVSSKYCRCSSQSMAATHNG